MSEREKDLWVRELEEKNRRIKELEAKLHEKEEQVKIIPPVTHVPQGQSYPPNSQYSTPPYSSSSITGSSVPTPMQPVGKLRVQEWGFSRRLVGIFRSPKRAMANIAGEPNYTEPVIIIIVQVMLFCIAQSLVLSKILLYWFWMPELTSMLFETTVWAGILMFAVWAIRSWIILVLYKQGTGWRFKSAAAVTGYAMIPVLLMNIPGLILISAMSPYVLSTMSLAAIQQATVTMKLIWALPLTLVGNAWQSYLGAHGVKAGTGGRRSFASGFTVFFSLIILELPLLLI